MRLLDLFCGAGGAATGYHRAGFTDIVGVDIKPQPRYPFAFVQADALEYVAAHGAEFDAIHASPPCQAYSEATPVAARASHPRLIEPTRAALYRIGCPSAMENVENARREMLTAVMLCGTMFGLKLWRHRYFEMSGGLFGFVGPASCNHAIRPITVRAGSNARKAQGGKRDLARERAAMGIDWMSGDELAEAIPPAYTEFIGRQLIAALEDVPQRQKAGA